METETGCFFLPARSAPPSISSCRVFGRPLPLSARSVPERHGRGRYARPIRPAMRSTPRQRRREYGESARSHFPAVTRFSVKKEPSLF